MKKYRVTINDDIHDQETGAWIPRDTGNRDYRAFLEWAQTNVADVDPEERPDTGTARRRRTAEKIRRHDPVAALQFERKYHL